MTDLLDVNRGVLLQKTIEGFSKNWVERLLAHERCAVNTGKQRYQSIHLLHNVLDGCYRLQNGGDMTEAKGILGEVSMGAKDTDRQ